MVDEEGREVPASCSACKETFEEDDLEPQDNGSKLCPDCLLIDDNQNGFQEEE